MIEGTIVAVSSDAHFQFSKPNRLSVELVAGDRPEVARHVNFATRKSLNSKTVQNSQIPI